jgi:hypothetical protein
MCDAAETSREHVPPKCLFPTTEDAGRDLRRNLITVPSCDVHNSQKSKDDEFLRAVITMSSAHVSDVGRAQFFGKLIRAIKRRPTTYGRFFEDTRAPLSGNRRALQLDRKRFNKCIDHIARALLFHHHSVKWVRHIAVASPAFYSQVSGGEMVPHPLSNKAVEVTQNLLRYEPIRGENPDVFKYRFQYDPSDESFAFAAQFYGTFDVCTFSSRVMDDAVA